MKFTDWLKKKNEATAGPTITPEQEYQVYRSVWPRLLPNEKWVMGQQWYTTNPELFKRVTGLQRPQPYTANPQQTVV